MSGPCRHRYTLPLKRYAPMASVGERHAAPVREAAKLLRIRCNAPFPPPHHPDVSLRGAKRRGNLAVPGRITGYFRRKRNCLHEIATGAKRPRNDKPLAFTVLRRPALVGGIAPGGACPSPTTRDWKLRVTLHYPLSIFHLHHAAPTTTALIRIGGGGHFLYYLPYRRSYIVFMRRRRWASSAVSRPGCSRQLQLRSLSVPGVFMRASAPRPR